MIYAQNKLLNISKQPVIPGWAKELCYRTLNKGVSWHDSRHNASEVDKYYYRMSLVSSK